MVTSQEHLVSIGSQTQHSYLKAVFLRYMYMWFKRVQYAWLNPPKLNRNYPGGMVPITFTRSTGGDEVEFDCLLDPL